MRVRSRSCSETGSGAESRSRKLAGGVICIGVRQRGLPPGGGASRNQEVAFVRDRLQPSIVANGSEGRLCTEIRQQGAIAA